MALNQARNGYHAWLLETIRTNIAGGEELVTMSKAFRGHEQYAWLLDRLQERGEVEIIENYRERRRTEVNDRAWRLKRLQLAGLDERIESRLQAGLHSSDSYSLRLQRTAEKLRKSIQKHELQQQGETDARTEQ